jgi:hypothetical protein
MNWYYVMIFVSSFIMGISIGGIQDSPGWQSLFLMGNIFMIYGMIQVNL